MKFKFFIILILFISLESRADNTLVSDSLRIYKMYESAKGYYDSSDYPMAIEYAKKAIENASKNRNVVLLAKSTCLLGEILYDTEEYKESIKQFSLSLRFYRQVNDPENISYCFHLIGMTYRRLNDFGQSMKAEIKALEFAEMAKNQKRISAASNGLGLVFHSLGKLDDAIKYYTISLNADQKNNDTKGVADGYLNLGAVYSDKHEPEKSLGFLLKSMSLYNKISDTYGLAMAYNNIGNRYIELKDFNLALEYHKKALNYEIENKNDEGIAYSYSNISEIYRGMRDYKMALEYKIFALKTSKDQTLKITICDSLTNIYSETNNYKEALYYKTLSSSLKDSIYNNESNRLVTEMQTRFETEKKEKENEVLKLDRQLQDSAIKRQYILIVSVSFGLALMLVLAYVLFRSGKKSKQTNALLSAQNAEIQQKNEEISSQRDEIASQRDLVTSQKERIENIHEEQTSSIRYAQQIQGAMLTSTEQMNEILGEHFTFFLPKDIVSGDFYWATKHNDNLIFCVADCTGHGVPGAFMSMLGISLLNEIVSKGTYTNVSDILNLLRINIISSLKQEIANSKDKTTLIKKPLNKDGMDISMCILNKKTMELQYAGANNPLYIVKAAAAAAVGSEMPLPTATAAFGLQYSQLIELKGDKMPISVHERMDSFTMQTISLQKGDCVYLFSDGYADQFGGKMGKKLMYKAFKEILTEISQHPVDIQRMEIEKYFRQWKGDHPQVDDVLVMGIKI